MKNLWAPWRLEFVSSAHDADKCFLCEAGSAEPNENIDRERHIIARGKNCFCLLNRYPYSNGHMLISPYIHESDLESLDDETLLEMMRMACDARVALERAVNAQGYNIGLNLGRDAGAGIADHLHLHVVPRWRGDTNFMSTVSQTKVIPQSLDDAWEKLRSYWPKDVEKKGG